MQSSRNTGNLFANCLIDKIIYGSTYSNSCCRHLSMEFGRHPKHQLTTIRLGRLNTSFLATFKVIIYRTFKIFSYFFDGCTFVRYKRAVKTLNLAKQALIFIAILYRTGITFIFQHTHFISILVLSKSQLCKDTNFNTKYNIFFEQKNSTILGRNFLSSNLYYFAELRH